MRLLTGALYFWIKFSHLVWLTDRFSPSTPFAYRVERKGLCYLYADGNKHQKRVGCKFRLCV